VQCRAELKKQPPCPPTTLSILLLLARLILTLYLNCSWLTLQPENKGVRLYGNQSYRYLNCATSGYKHTPALIFFRFQIHCTLNLIILLFWSITRKSIIVVRYCLTTFVRRSKFLYNNVNCRQKQETVTTNKLCTFISSVNSTAR